MSKRLTPQRARAHMKALARVRVASGRLSREVAEYSLRITLDTMEASGERWSESRLCAYFDAVARRRTLRAEPHGIHGARLVADAVVADLMESGRKPQDVWDMLVSGWRDSLPLELLDEYRVRLCA